MNNETRHRRLLARGLVRFRCPGAIAAFAVLFLALPASGPAALAGPPPDEAGRLRVVTTLTEYAWIASRIGGDAVEVHAIARGNQDAHFVRPRPSYTALLRKADLFVTTGLDLELWVPTLLDASGNPHVLEGQKGYVAAYAGVPLLDKPAAISRSEGDVHIWGNPHLTTDPLNVIVISRNILAGFIKVAPEREAAWRAGQKALEDRLHRRLFGDELVDLLGGGTLERLARSGNLMEFLSGREYPRGSGRMLSERLGGWLERAAPLRGRTVIGYHKNWIYFAERFGLRIAGYVEPKPGIPPTPRHVQEIIDLIRNDGIDVILTANYFDPNKPEAIAERTGARVAIVPLHVGGEPGVDGYEDLVDLWLDRLLEAFSRDAG